MLPNNPAIAGTAALHPDWPAARFNVSGMWIFHPVVLHVMDIARQAWDCRLPVEAMHGAPAVSWNAGCALKINFEPRGLQPAMDSLFSHGVGYFPTFTNHLLAEKDLDYPVCNQILQCLARRPELNGVIVVSERLSRYIARSYPALRQVASIIKVTFDRGEGSADYYRALGERFFRYVVHPDDCRNLALLERLDRDKAEIIVNENCVADCPTRARHYDAYARWQHAANPQERQAVDEEIRQIVAGCQSPHHLHRVANGRRSCNLTRSELKTIYDMGFRHFKLQGRGDNVFAYLFDLTRFLLENEFVAPLVFKVLCPCIHKE